MKKKLTLMCLALLTLLGGVVFAQSLRRAETEKCTLTLNGSEVSSPEGFFTHDTSGKFNFNAKFNGMYDGVEFAKGLKMEGTTKIMFTSTFAGTLKIVQSTWSDKTIKFDGTELAVSDATTPEGSSGCRLYTIENVAAGDHTITRGSGESGLFYVELSSGESGGDEPEPQPTVNVVFSATVTSTAKVSFDAKSTTEITSDWAEITGGKMFAISEQEKEKELITSQGGGMNFCITNSNTYFKVELDDVLTEGDVISAKGFSRTDSELGLFLSTATSRPNECSTKLHIDQVEKNAGATDYSSYTVVAGDGLEGAKEFYIYREIGKNTYFNNFMITRPLDDGIPKYQKTVDFTTLTAKDVDEMSEDVKSAIDEVEILDQKTGTTVTIIGSGDAEAPNKYNVSGEGASTVVTLEMNGGTMTFDALESRTIKKVTFYYDEWNAKNAATTEVVEAAAVPRRADAENDDEAGDGDEEEPVETNMTIDEEKKTAAWEGYSQRVIVTFAGKSVIKKIVIEVGERVGEEVVLDLPTGKDISKEVNDVYIQNPYVGKVTVNLEKDGKYTADKTIYISKPFILNGAEGAEVDASGNNGPLIQLAEVPELGLNAAGAYEISEVTLKDVKISGVKNRLFFAARQKYLLKKLSVENSVIHIDGFTPAAIFDFYYGGNTEELSIVNSTLWANPANTMLGGLLNTQSGQDVEELGGSSQKIVIKNSTLYSIAYGKAPVLLRNYGQDWMSFEVTDNVIVNSGEKGQFLLGLNTGTKGASTWTVSGNAFSFDGEDTGAAETLSAAIADAAIAGGASFTDAENGDFSLDIYSQAFDEGKGDPRWLTPGAGSLVLDVADGKDLGTEYAAAKGDGNPSKVLIRLAKDGKYTVGSTLEIGGNLVVKGAGATVDAATLEGPLVKLSETPAVAAVNKTDDEGNETLLGYHIEQVTLQDVTVSNLTQSLFSSNKQQYLVKKLTLDNSIIGIGAAVKKTLFDFAGNGNTEELRIQNSTLWATADAEWQNGGLFSSQSGKEVTDLGGSEEKLTIVNSTLYNICKGKTMNTLRKNNQKYQGYDIRDNVVVNCGKQNEFLVGLAGGRINNKDIWSASGNIINYDVADAEGAVTLTDIGDAETSKSGLAAPTVEGLAQFKNAAEGDFLLALRCGANLNRSGDPRWVRVEHSFYIEPADGSDIAAVLDAEYATLGEREVPGMVIIVLAKDGKYTASKSINLSAELMLLGQNATIDASALTAPLFQMNSTPVLDAVESGQYVITSPMIIENVTVTGLTKALFADGGKGYCYDSFIIDNSVFQYTTQENVVLNMAASMAVNLYISNSTFYSLEPGTANFIAMSGKRPWQTTGYEEETGKFTCANNTFYNVAKGKQFMNTNTLKGQRYLYEFNSNIFANVSNKKIYGNMTNNAKQLTTDEKNTYIFDGEFFSETNYNGDAGLQSDPSFADAANGDFTLGAGTLQAQYQTGDPRWLVEYVPTGIGVVKEATAAEGEWYTLQGVRVDKPAKGVYLHNGRKVVIR